MIIKLPLINKTLKFVYHLMKMEKLGIIRTFKHIQKITHTLIDVNVASVDIV